MATQLNTNNIQIGTTTIWDGDVNVMGRKVYSQVDWGICFTNGLTWGAGIPNGAGTRYGSVLYVTRGVYKTGGAVDGYGTPIAGVNYPTNGSISTGYDTFTYTNTSLSRSVRILIYAGAANPISFPVDQHNSGIGAGAPLANAGRGTDDNHYTTVFRGGTPASGTSHSGGTALCTNKFGSYVAYETIPANTSYTYWHYSNISGSNADSHATRFWGEFQNFV